MQLEVVTAVLAGILGSGIAAVLGIEVADARKAAARAVSHRDNRSTWVKGSRPLRQHRARSRSHRSVGGVR